MQARAKQSFLAVVLLLATGLGGCGNDENCSCPDGGGQCTVDVVEDTAQGDIPQVDVVPDAAEVTGEDLPDHPDDAKTETDVPNEFLTGTAVMNGKVTFTNMTDYSGIDVFLHLGYIPTNVVASTKTAADGSWTIHGVPAGPYTVVASYGEYTKAGMAEKGIDVEDGETVTVRDLSLTAYGTLEGSATFVGFDPGILDDDAGINVYLPSREQVVLTDADGQWEMVWLLPGEYRVCAGYNEMVGSCSNVTVEGLKTAVVPAFEVKAWNASEDSDNDISGVVTMAGKSDSTGIKVEAFWSGNFQAETTTDASGAYHFTNLQPGEYWFQYSAPDGSGYEQNAEFSTYPIYGGVTETIPPQVLSSGRVVTERHINMLIQEAEFSPDSRYVLYRTDDNMLISRDLTIDDETLGSSFVDHGVESFWFSADSAFVAYRPVADSQLLFTKPLDGGPRKLITWEFGGYLKFTHDSAFLIFSKDFADEGTSWEVWAANPDTGDSHFLCMASSRAAIWVSPDSSVIACIDGDDELNIAKIADGTVIYTGAGVDGFRHNPDASILVTCDDADDKLVAVDLQTGTPTDLQGDAGWCEIEVTPNAVIYLGADEKLMSSPLAGGEPTVLASDTLMPLDLTPDMTRVIARKRSDSSMLRYDIYSVETIGGTPVLLATKVNGENWNNNDWYLPETGLPQDVSYMMGKNSDVIYVASDLNAADEQVRTLHRVKLDGTADDLMFTLSRDVNAYKTVWDVNEDLGLAVGSQVDGTVGIYDLATGTVTSTLESVGGAGLMSPDRTTLIRFYGDAPLLGWYRLDDTTTTPLTIDAESRDSHGMGDLALQYKFSPDSKHLLFLSIFGRAASGYFEFATQRLYVVDLD